MKKISIVVAVRDGEANLAQIKERLALGFSQDIETIYVLASTDSTLFGTLPARTKVIFSPADMLIPQLWAVGIMAATGEWVALTTAQCVPSPGWIQKLREVTLDSRLAVGGAIVNDSKATKLNWAIYLLRYSSFLPESPGGARPEIAADNAVYRRAAILKNADLLRHGFWEPSFHARFRSEGHDLTFDPDLLVEHKGLISGRAFAGARFRHGREFGLARSGGSGVLRRILLVFASPLIPFILFKRVASRTLGHPRYRGQLVAAAPWLTIFTLAWSLGEASGYVRGLWRGRGVLQSAPAASLLEGSDG